MTEIKERLLKTLKAFISFCEENQLTYYGACGTVLGAVRHHGFIPWDDDIDVYMPQADYKRLKTLQNQIPNPYQLGDISEMGYTAPFMKFMDMNSSIWEFERIPYMIGVYVDIFPLDDCPDDPKAMIEIKQQLNNAFFQYFRSLEEWTMLDLLKMLVHRDRPALSYRYDTKFHYVPKRKAFHKEVLRLLDELSHFKGEHYYFNTTDVYAECLVFKKEWFENPVDMPFEDITIKIPGSYDEYLKYLYEDYMKLPPVEERNSHHARTYMNLDRWVSIDEAKSLIRVSERNN